MATKMQVRADEIRVGDILDWSHCNQWPVVIATGSRGLKVALRYKTKGRIYCDFWEPSDKIWIERETY